MVPACRLSPILLVLTWLTSAGPALAEGRTQLELFADPRAPVTSQQEWLRQLAGAGVTGLRIRVGQPSDKVGIEVRGTESSPVYLVFGMITPGNELVLPGGKYRASEASQIARWLKDLALKGPGGGKPEPKAPFGLSPDEFAGIHKDLEQPVAFSTKGMDRAAALRKLGGQLAFALRIGTGLLETSHDDKISEELSVLSAGTALACMLRPAGFCLVPRPTRDGKPEYVVTPSEPGAEVWPVGWKPQKSTPQVLPGLYESFNANIQDYPLAKVLDALGPRLKAPIFLDHNALARHAVEPDKVKVSAPQSRVTYNQLLRKILSQSGLKSEVRIDESGRPFLWVTTVKPL